MWYWQAAASFCSAISRVILETRMDVERTLKQVPAAALSAPHPSQKNSLTKSRSGVYLRPR
jgi:hypothetical protein